VNAAPGFMLDGEASEMNVWRSYIGRPRASVLVNGDDPMAQYDFLLDTGTPSTWVTSEIRAYLSLA
jgi:hypothetical protein